MGKYQGYQNYKDSGVEWLGDIPEHWEKKRFKFSVNLINNKIEAENSNLSYMGLEHIESWTGKRIEDKNASSEGIGAHFLPNDVLFGKLRPYLAKVYLSEIEGLASTEALVLRCKNNIFPKFLKYYILSRDFINIVDSSTFGAKMPRASWDFIGNLFFIFPPLNEQQAIANFLDYKTKQIDELIKKKQTLIEKLDEKRTAIISHAVTKGLDSTVPMKDSGIEWLGDIPKHWEVKRLNFLTKKIGDGIHSTPNYIDASEYYFINGNNLINGNIVITESTKCVSKDEFDKYNLNLDMDTLLLSINGTVGNLAFYQNELVMLGKSAAYIILKSEVFRKFAYYYLLSRNTKNYFFHEVTGTTILNLSLKSIKNTFFPIPPLNEQQAIANFLDQKTAQIDQQKAKIKQAIELLKEYRTSLITNTVTGKIDVRQVIIP